MSSPAGPPAAAGMEVCGSPLASGAHGPQPGGGGLPQRGDSSSLRRRATEPTPPCVLQRAVKPVTVSRRLAVPPRSEGGQPGAAGADPPWLGWFTHCEREVLSGEGCFK